MTNRDEIPVLVAIVGGGVVAAFLAVAYQLGIEVRVLLVALLFAIGGVGVAAAILFFTEQQWAIPAGIAGAGIWIAISFILENKAKWLIKARHTNNYGEWIQGSTPLSQRSDLNSFTVGGITDPISVSPWWASPYFLFGVLAAIIVATIYFWWQERQHRWGY